jgi:hypothetical protein
VGITARAEDADSTNNRITYSLDDDADGLFAINPSSGVVTLISSLENLTASECEITVRASSDDGSYSLRSFSITLIQDVESEPEGVYLDEIIFEFDPALPGDTDSAVMIPGESNSGRLAEEAKAVEGISEEKAEDSMESEALSPLDQGEPLQWSSMSDEGIIARFTSAMINSEGRGSNDFTFHRARLTPQPVALDELPLLNTMVGGSVEAPEAIWELLDVMGREMSDSRNNDQTSSDGVVMQAATVGTISLSAGYVAWLLRAGVLSASLLSSVPLWRQVDPLPVLSARAKTGNAKRDDFDNHDPKERRLARLFSRKISNRRNLITDTKG